MLVLGGILIAMRLVPGERTALCDLFDELGPEAPTVLPGWRANELLAHLLVRERQPWAAPGILIPALAPITHTAMRGYDTTPWGQRVDVFRSGPPLWSPYRVGTVDERGNLMEFVVHYEDLARAQPQRPLRPSTPERDEAIWSALRLAARVMYRKSPVGVVLRHPSRPHGGQISARSGGDQVTVTGAPLELLLHAFGRDVARVELAGSPDDVAALTAAPRGI